MDLESVRDSLIRQEDTIIFSLIERAKFPINSQAYASPQYGFDVFPAPSFLHFFVRESEALHAKVVPPSSVFFLISFFSIVHSPSALVSFPEWFDSISDNVYEEFYLGFEMVAESLLQSYKETWVPCFYIQAGRYENPEENPFFPDDLPPSMVPTNDYNNKQVIFFLVFLSKICNPLFCICFAFGLVIIFLWNLGFASFKLLH